jgi:hypothetical protein
MGVWREAGLPFLSLKKPFIYLTCQKSYERRTTMDPNHILASFGIDADRLCGEPMIVNRPKDLTMQG